MTRQEANIVEVPYRTGEEADSQAILRILERHDGDRGGLIAILEEIQALRGYLPEWALRVVADRMGRSLVDVYGVATFYRSFSLQPRCWHRQICSPRVCCSCFVSPFIVGEVL